MVQPICFPIVSFCVRMRPGFFGILDYRKGVWDKNTNIQNAIHILWKIFIFFGNLNFFRTVEVFSQLLLNQKDKETRQKMALGERRSREGPCFLIVFKWTKTRNKWLAKLSREQKGGILNTTNISIATVLYSQRVFADISSSYLQPGISWHVKISNQDVRIFVMSEIIMPEPSNNLVSTFSPASKN